MRVDNKFQSNNNTKNEHKAIEAITQNILKNHSVKYPSVQGDYIIALKEEYEEWIDEDDSYFVKQMLDQYVEFI